MLTQNQINQNNSNDQKLVGKKLLIILPHHNFRDKEYSWLMERFEPTGVTVEVAASHLSEAQGRFGTLVKPDVLIEFVEAGDYDAFVFVGEEAATNEFVNNKDIQRILENAYTTRKIVAAIGCAVLVIAFTGRLVGRKVTTSETEKGKIEEYGAYFTGRLVEQDGDVITANGPYATREFAETIIKALAWSTNASQGGRQYLR